MIYKKVQTQYEYITIFGVGAGKDGQSTLRFENIRDLFQNYEVLKFKYTSASTNDELTATFFVDTISGYSLPENKKGNK